VRHFRQTAIGMTAEIGIPQLGTGKILSHVEHGIADIYDRYHHDKEKQGALNAYRAQFSRKVSDLEQVTTCKNTEA
jgi:hypothetical protein